MSQPPPAQRFAERLIRVACRRLPDDARAERCREWAAELPAIVGDQGIRPSFLRSLRALTFCIGISRTTRKLSRPARAASRRTRIAQGRSGASRTRPKDVAVRLAAGLAAWIVVVAGAIAVLTTHPDPRDWPFLLVVAVMIVFDAFCLADIARTADIRYLRKWQWAVVCLIQVPLGGILYLSLGRIGPARRLPPGEAKP